MDDDLKPQQGSYPFSFSWDDFQTTSYNTLVVAAVASLHYISATVLPTIHPADPPSLIALTMATSALNALLAYLGDTRPRVEQRRLTYAEFKRIRYLRKMQPGAGRRRF